MIIGNCINFKTPTNKNNSLQCKNSKQTLNFNNSIDEKSCLQTRTLLPYFAEDGICSKKHLVLYSKKKKLTTWIEGNTIRELERKLENKLRRATEKKNWNQIQTQTKKIRFKTNQPSNLSLSGRGCNSSISYGRGV